MQNTKFNLFIKSFKQLLFSSVNGTWRYKSTVILSLLSGFYLTNNLVSYSLDKNYNSLLIVILLVACYEIVIRAKYLKDKFRNNIYFIILDNLRIGITFSLVLEAFKLGS